jgi:endonuclease I
MMKDRPQAILRIGQLTRQGRFTAAFVCAATLLVHSALADAFDPPAGYYSSATGSGATLKSQLNSIIKTGHTSVSYDALRSALQVTDADPNNAGRMLLVYDRASLNVAAINPGGLIPGWDEGVSWNREHTWPVSRGLGSDSSPDGSDLHHLRPSTPGINTDRGNQNFGGAFGQAFGEVEDGGSQYWYPGNADAGMIARSQFYMAVRYDGADAGTTDLELAAGNVPDMPGTTDPPPQFGNLSRMLEWHFAAPPDSFERRRHQIVYDTYQHNRNPFIDRPELAWSVFVDEANDSQITIDGGAPTADGGSLRHVDLGRVYVGGVLPEPELYSLDKTGMDGSYFEVTTAGAATSSIGGRFNAFRMGGPFSKNISVGLDTSTATTGLKTGTVTVDNLDITTGGGLGHGANDANDVFDVSLAVLDHPLASFSLNLEQRERVIDFGIVPVVSAPKSMASGLTNLAAAGGPDFAANLDLDSIVGVGNTDVFEVDLAPFSGLQQGDAVAFDSIFIPDVVGQFAATYTLMLSDEDLPGEQTQTLTLSLMAEAILGGDYNRNGVVDAADYIAWRHTLGQDGAAYHGADGDGDGMIDDDDYNVWRANFGATAATAGSFAPTNVPEPASAALAICLFAFTWRTRARTKSCAELSRRQLA